MLELHKQGIKVTFYEGNPAIESDKSQFFRVEMPAGVSLEEYAVILSRIHAALKESAELTKGEAPAKLTRQLAMNYVSKANSFKDN